MSPTSRRFYSSTQILEGSINTITAYHRDLEERIADVPFWQRWIQKPKNIKALKDTLALAKHIHGLLLAAKEIVETNEAQSRRLRSQLQNFRKSLGNRSSPTLISLRNTRIP